MSHNLANQIRRYAEVWNSGKTELLSDILSADVIYHNSPMPDLNREALAHFITEWRKGCPDFQVTLYEDLVTGNKTAHRWSHQETYTAECSLLPYPPTGKQMGGPGSLFIHWVDSKAVEVWHYADWLHGMWQGGILPNIWEGLDWNLLTQSHRLHNPYHKQVLTGGRESRDLKHQYHHYATVWNTGDLDLLPDIFAANLVCHVSPFPDMNLEALASFILGFRKGFPDLCVTVDDDIVLENRTAHRWTWQGTFAGETPLLPFPPTHKHAKGPGSHVVHWEDGRVVEMWHYGDWLGALQQLGILPTFG